MPFGLHPKAGRRRPRQQGGGGQKAFRPRSCAEKRRRQHQGGHAQASTRQQQQAEAGAEKHRGRIGKNRSEQQHKTPHVRLCVCALGRALGAQEKEVCVGWGLEHATRCAHRGTALRERPLPKSCGRRHRPWPSRGAATRCPQALSERTGPLSEGAGATHPPRMRHQAEGRPGRRARRVLTCARAGGRRQRGASTAP